MKIYTYIRYKNLTNYIIVDSNFNCLEYVKLVDKFRKLIWLKKSDYLTYDEDSLVEVNGDPDIIIFSLFQFIENICNTIRREDVIMTTKESEERIIIVTKSHVIRVQKDYSVTIEENSYKGIDFEGPINEDTIYSSIDWINELVDFLVD